MILEEIVISEATAEDWEQAMELAWLTFMKYDAPDYTAEGIENFLQFISDEKLFKLFLVGEYRLYVAKHKGMIVGMTSLRAVNHISLLFVKDEYQRQGIGRKLLKYAQNQLADRNVVKISVNASPYGVVFYRKLGFLPTEDEKQTDGIRYTPMICISQI